MDRMMSFLEQAWRRLVEMANRVQKDVTRQDLRNARRPGEPQWTTLE